MSTVDASIVASTSSFKGSTLTYTVVAIKDTTMELSMDPTMDSAVRGPPNPVREILQNHTRLRHSLEEEISIVD